MNRVGYTIRSDQRTVTVDTGDVSVSVHRADIPRMFAGFPNRAVITTGHLDMTVTEARLDVSVSGTGIRVKLVAGNLEVPFPERAWWHLALIALNPT